MSKIFNIGGAKDYWSIAGGYPSSRTLSVLAQFDAATSDVVFDSTGLKMYVIGSTDGTAKRWCCQYALSTPFAMHTGAYTGKNVNLSTKIYGTQKMAFSGDGTKVYFSAESGVTNNAIYQYGLSTAWDISTATYTKVLNVSVDNPQLRGVLFKVGGTKLYTLSFPSKLLRQYDLGTAWDIATAVVTATTFNCALDEFNPMDVKISADGTKLHVVGQTDIGIYQYRMVTPWDIGAAALFMGMAIAPPGAQESFLRNVSFPIKTGVECSYQAPARENYISTI